MNNLFAEIEDNILFNENIIFNEAKIKEHITNHINKELIAKSERERPFFFEQIIYDFFEYKKIELIKTPKTRDFGLDGIIKLELSLLREINLGVQIKYKIIDSTDIDMFSSALKNAELQVGVVICNGSRRLEKYELNSKIKAILLSRGIKLKEKILEENININPIFVLKFEDIIEMASTNIRLIAKSIYKI